jgi:hypothetical protein
MVFVHLLYILHSDLIEFSFLCSVKHPVQMIVSVNFQTQRYCWIIVRLLFSILILEMYSRYFDSAVKNHLLSQYVNIIQVHDLPTFVLA